MAKSSSLATASTAHSLSLPPKSTIKPQCLQSVVPAVPVARVVVEMALRLLLAVLVVVTTVEPPVLPEVKVVRAAPVDSALLQNL